MTDETKPTKEETLADLRRQVKELEKQLAGKDVEIDKMKRKEEGWLVWTPDPRFNGQTMSVNFTDGMAFIQKDNKYPEGDADWVVRLLVGDFGYEAQYFTKEQSDELKSKMNKRAAERKEIESKFGTREDMLEKLLEKHRL